MISVHRRGRLCQILKPFPLPWLAETATANSATFRNRETTTCYFAAPLSQLLIRKRYPTIIIHVFFRNFEENQSSVFSSVLILCPTSKLEVLLQVRYANKITQQKRIGPNFGYKWRKALLWICICCLREGDCGSGSGSELSVFRYPLLFGQRSRCRSFATSWNFRR